MIGIRWRLRPLLLLVTASGLAAALAIVYAGSRGFLLQRMAGPAASVPEGYGQSFLLYGLLGSAIALLAMFGAATVLLRQPVERMRAAAQVLARGERPPRVRRPSVAEYQALAAALERLAGEQDERFAGLARERDELALLVNFVSEGILQIGSDGRLIRANPPARALLGMPPESRGQPLSSLVRQGELRALLERAAAGTTIRPTEISIDDRRILVGARPMTAGEAGAAEPLGGAIVAFLDLTELRRLEGVRRDFVANVSHELKTPLTSIRGYVETLLSDELPDEMRRQFLEVIRSNAERLQGIVDDLLDLSRLESGGWRPELQDIDPLLFAEEVWIDHRDIADRKRIDFDIGGDTALVRADPAGLRQVLTNLYDNAIRHTPDGGAIQVRVRAAHARANGQSAGIGVLLEIRDTGSGIPWDALPRIFERFYRVDPARSRAEGGTGLGLSIVKHLAEAMGGGVTAESELGKGTTIRLRLPAALADHSVT